MGTAVTSVRTYMTIWGWLAGLMLLGVLLSESGLALPKRAVVLIVLALSTAKALLVAGYYMHLRTDRRLLALIMIAPLVMVVLVVALLYSSLLVRL